MDKKVIMKQGLKAKFEQNSDLKEKLLKTVGSEIIERSTDDKYWSQLANGEGLYLYKLFVYIDKENCNKLCLWQFIVTTYLNRILSGIIWRIRDILNFKKVPKMDNFRGKFVNFLA